MTFARPSANDSPLPIGATVSGGSTSFVVWTPAGAQLLIDGIDGVRRVDMEPVGRNMWTATVDGAGHGTTYRYELPGHGALPDPASAWQPDGVHGASAVVDPSRFAWTDHEWRGRTLAGTIVYELHVGTFTPGGTLDSAIGQLDRLSALGVTTIELMPVNAFPGMRNWGYDGVFPWAVHRAYGGPEALARFVDAAHTRGLAVILDVVYNHVGPEGNVLTRFAPYFVTDHHTPWGPALNVAGPGSDAVREYFVQNAVRWIRDFHVDGFRFDAVHAVIDSTANPFWAQICASCRIAAAAERRSIVLIAESSDNDPRQLHGPDRNGIGFDAVWCDDVHHALRVAMTRDVRGYYIDYDGSPTELADTVTHRWKFRGQFSEARGRHHGRSVDEVAPHRFVASTQTHDQVGNRPAGERPDHHITAPQRRFAPSVVLLSPYTPMLFMGEEYGERRPFPFFVDHQDDEVLRATNEGRRAEFAGADWSVDVPEPGAIATFEGAVLDPTVVDRDANSAGLQRMYTELLRLRRHLDPIAGPAAVQLVQLDRSVVSITRTVGTVTTTVFVNDADDTAAVAASGTMAYRSDDPRWGGDGRTAIEGDRLVIAPWTVALVLH